MNPKWKGEYSLEQLKRFREALIDNVFDYFVLHYGQVNFVCPVCGATFIIMDTCMKNTNTAYCPNCGNEGIQFYDKENDKNKSIIEGEVK